MSRRLRWDGADCYHPRMLTLPAIPFPVIDPILLQIGPFAIRWYALAYIAGLVLGWRYLLWFARRDWTPFQDKDVDDFLVWATLGVVLGGRTGYVLFYNFGYYLQNPGDILMVWQGGMSFHGGLIGVVLAVVLFTRLRGIPTLSFGDYVACVAPIGLFFGRIANFINAELYGRVSDAPWAMVFPGGGPLPRHPSQLYEALLEGALLFLLLLLASRTPRIRQTPGAMLGILLAGYAAARMFIELFREPDPQIGFLWSGITMGQLLSLPMLLIGLWFFLRAYRR
ncbi:Prolipoprotein diacylglyceryl transferase [Oceanibacterium hippocampi]|uniref:Phosphatidylglycerol--prolipoprotein diacylglyceryl transferase n=2 Tax=Oceanibacterium hippocampi TaxID=745714 RepID=A0A1Y5U1I1_9PROT|nr:prolipoprotein diacylglyceryl transferase [Oceanibacterium hippocampi]SLN74512.1 Prolipoprotein diacylglyceryl transferase [Oceanibacterium hippocampi]